MVHDVFISHSTKNKRVADAVCATLEKAAIRCWIAPRDVQPGRPFAGEITRAIKRSKAMVLIFSADSNNSPQILRELQLAADARLHIIPFRIEDLAPNEDLAYYLAGPHWFDATTAPLEQHLGRFAISLRPLLGPPEKGASKERPYENSLGMRFVPLAGTGLLFSVWETRVKDYAVFAKATGRKRSEPDFRQTEEHPAVNVSWDDAVAFCQWLTKQERKAGRIGVNQSYRLPSDLEWSAAVGLENERGDTPQARDSKVESLYPWGTEWPPPDGAGNYGSALGVDRYEGTSPVGRFEANEKGIYDLGGNVWEWCEDWWNSDQKYRILRGASWFNDLRGNLVSSFRDDRSPDNRRGSLLSSYREYAPPGRRYADYGFRCVLEVESSR
jgi:hypothetical protein